MFGKIVYISDSVAHIAVPENQEVKMDLMNLYVVFETENRKVLGEVEDVSKEIIKVHFLGVIENGKSNLTYDRLKKFCEVSGYTADYILFGRDVKKI